MIMASEEDVKNESCINDPDFAVVCSFFENFSSLCGVQAPSFLDLQQMLEDTQFSKFWNARYTLPLFV
jgi:hypothetical protein